MANKEQVILLKQGKAGWNPWRKVIQVCCQISVTQLSIVGIFGVTTFIMPILPVRQSGPSEVAVEHKCSTTTSESQIPATLCVRFGPKSRGTLFGFLTLNSQQSSHGNSRRPGRAL